METNSSLPILCSVIVPVYNEEANIGPLTERLTRTLDSIPGCEHEIIFAMDPSTDRTEERILEIRSKDPRVKLIRFSRRFGQPAATLGGLRYARGDICVVIDADLQDPPEVIAELIRKWRESGADVVYAQRRTRVGETLPKRIIAYFGYWAINKIADVQIPRNTGDFRLMTRRVVNHLLSLKECHGFLRGLVALVGFRQECVQYDRQKRLGGKGHYNRWTGSFLIGINGIVGFSRFSLTAISILGFITSGISLFIALVYSILRLLNIEIPWGNPTLVILITFFAGIQLLCIGILGAYIGRIYDEVRERPMYIVESAYGFDEVGESE
jgi:glycosyltransferase involved in cell wall biosynthesis